MGDSAFVNFLGQTNAKKYFNILMINNYGKCKIFDSQKCTQILKDFC